MSGGLLALLDDVALIAKVAAASLDDAAAQAVKASAKAAGIVIDDAAVTPRYVEGFAADREIPIVAKIALGSIKNKLLYLLPASLLLSALAPWAITPLLMLGGAYLCIEGYEKIYHAMFDHGEDAEEIMSEAEPVDPLALENERVSGAIRTDIILSAEIMAISLASVAESSFVTQVTVLIVVAVLITVAVYGAVALIVKADDAGLALANNQRPISSGLGLLRRAPTNAPTGLDKVLRPVTQGFGRGLVKLMPPLLQVLTLIGTAAMLWVGGGIILHGLGVYGWAQPEHLIQELALTASAPLGVLAPLVNWLVAAAMAALIGIGIGGIVDIVWRRTGMPILRLVKLRRARRKERLIA